MEGEGGDVAGGVVAIAVVGEGVGAVGEAVGCVLRGREWGCWGGRRNWGKVGGGGAECAA